MSNFGVMAKVDTFVSPVVEGWINILGKAAQLVLVRSVNRCTCQNAL